MSQHDASNGIRSIGWHDVHVWCHCTESHNHEDPNVVDVLSAKERAQRDRLRRPADKRDYAFAHVLLRRSLSRYAAVPAAEWQFETSVSGKPHLRDRAMEFNIAHAPGLVACAITRRMAVGVDVERTNRVRNACELADRFFSPSEAAALRKSGSDVSTRFVELWTLKEAFLKAAGIGLSGQLDGIAFDLDARDSQITFSVPLGYRAGEWHFALYAPSVDTRLAVATRSANRVHWLTRDTSSGGSLPLEPIRESR